MRQPGRRRSLGVLALGALAALAVAIGFLGPAREPPVGPDGHAPASPESQRFDAAELANPSPSSSPGDAGSTARAAAADASAQPGRPLAFAIRGRVVDERGLALPSFTVFVDLPGRPPPPSPFDPGFDVLRREEPGLEAAVRAVDGSFAVAVPAEGAWEVAVENDAEERAPAQLVELPRDAARELRFVLPRPASIAGRVLDPDGAPAHGAAVAQQLASHDFRREYPAGPDGSFQMPFVRAGAVRLVARLPGALDARVDVDVAPGEVRSDVVLQLVPGGAIEGLVRDEEGRPLHGVNVQAFRGGTERPRASGVSDADGRYRIAAVEPGWTRVEAHELRVLGLSARQHVEVVARRVARVDLGGPFEARVVVRGVVTTTGPVADAVIAFARADEADPLRRTTRSRADGTYEIALGAAGEHVVSVNGPGLAELERRVAIGDAPEAVVDLAFGAHRVTGRVLDADGRPCAGATVRLVPRDGAPSSGRRDTGSDGAFAFEGVHVGAYEVRAEPASPSGRDRGEFVAVAAPARVVRGAADPHVELAIQRGAAVRVRATLLDGRPAERAWVKAWSPDTREFANGVTDVRGEVVLGPLPAGDVLVEASTSMAVTPERRRAALVAGERASLDLVLVPGARVELVLLDADGVPLAEPALVPAGFDVAGRDDPPIGVDRVRGTGPRILGPATPGPRRVWARFGEREVAAEVELRAGTTHTVVLREPR